MSVKALRASPTGVLSHCSSIFRAGMSSRGEFGWGWSISLSPHLKPSPLIWAGPGDRFTSTPQKAYISNSKILFPSLLTVIHNAGITQWRLPATYAAEFPHTKLLLQHIRSSHVGMQVFYFHLNAPQSPCTFMPLHWTCQQLFHSWHHPLWDSQVGTQGEGWVEGHRTKLLGPLRSNGSFSCLPTCSS